MKFSLILLSFLALACGKIEVTTKGSSTVGESRSVNAFSVLSSTDRNNLTAVCNALATKAAVVPSLVSSSYNFTANTTDCDDKLTAELNVETIIQNNGLNFVFKRKINNQDFIFPDVETNTSGLLADTCNLLTGLQNPLVSGSSATYVTTSGIDPNDCTPLDGEICVSVEKAAQQGNFFIVHTKEWMRVRVSSPTGARIGFWTQRKKVTRGSCGFDDVLQFQSNLK